MLLYVMAGLVTLFFTTLLTIAGVGAAFILIPVFIAMGIEIHVSMATALLLNSIAMIFASFRFGRAGLIMWKTAVPIIIVASILSPAGAYVSKFLDAEVLLWLFTAFLLFAAGMMLFYNSKEKSESSAKVHQIKYGIGVGAFAGFLGGLLGVGGGNFIVPVLVWVGFNPKKASATTAFIVVFSSFSGFLGHMTFGSVNIPLLIFCALGSAGGALAGAWLMTEKLKRKQVKIVIGLVLLGIAAKMIVNLIMKG